MTTKIIGIVVFLALVVSIAVAGVAQVAQALDESRAATRVEAVVALNSPAVSQQDTSENGALYSAFTFVCPFH